MSLLILRNHNSDAELQQVTFDLKTGHFVTDTKQIISQNDLDRLDFSHPILQESPLVETQENRYSYLYNNDEEFYLALRYAYATLIQAKNPNLCSIELKPSREFWNQLKHYKIYFSADAKKTASQQLSTVQLNTMITKLSNKSFQYCNHVFIDRALTWVDFVKEMDADTLYMSTPPHPPVGVEHQASLDRFEIRFINTEIGYGVFARTSIKQGDLIAQYCGKIDSKKLKFKNYCYGTNKTRGYNLLLDGCCFGNISRFVNHAPKLESQLPPPAGCLDANLYSESQLKYGNSLQMMLANRDIAPGEQLLVSYGQEYFKEARKMFYLKKNGNGMDINQLPVKNNPLVFKNHLSMFAYYGNRRAQWLLFGKPIIILLMFIGYGLWSR